MGFASGLSRLSECRLCCRCSQMGKKRQTVNDALGAGGKKQKKVGAQPSHASACRRTAVLTLQRPSLLLAGPPAGPAAAAAERRRLRRAGAQR